MVKKILVAIDGSSQAEKAIDLAADVALCNNAAIYLLHVVQERQIPEGVREFIRTDRDGDPPGNVYLEVAAEKIIQAAEEKIKDKGIKEVRPFVTQGDPAEKILKFARQHDIDLIAMGSHGYGGVVGMVLGSVSRKVCNSSTECTCLIVR